MLKMILSVVLVLVCICLTAVVLFQEGKTSGLNSAVGGGSDTFLSKNKSKSWNAKLANWTKWVAIGFMVLALVMCML
ncbi:MAG: preprotein translocase subunit SecG [Oscillospiraceae bacterium]|nr:preprotein translocase subunit SecG [Oscillospiraceae bacterium]MBP3519728.1 preprotein translocase subunit SecG [Oscillospiraceae bacterium]